MAGQQPKTEFGKRESTESVSELIKNHLITFGLNKMAEPVQLLAKWIIEKPNEPVTIICPERQPTDRVEKLFSEISVETRVIDLKDKLSDESAYYLTIPPLCERLEDIPLITEVVINENLKIYSREYPGIHPSYIPVLYFLCHTYDSPTGLNTPLLTEDKYFGFLRKALAEDLFDKTANEQVQYSFQLGDSEETKFALRPFTLLEDKYVKFYPARLSDTYRYHKEDNEIAASAIAPYDSNTGRMYLYPAHIRSISSGDFRHFLSNSKLTQRDRNDRKLVAIDSLQQGMIKIGAKCIPYLAKLKISPIQNIYTLYVESKKALAKLIPSSTKDRDQEKPNLTIFETDNSVVCKNVKYTLRRGSYFDAIKIIAEQILKGNPSVGKDYIYDSCNITSEAIRAGSIKKWFIASGGDPERFARDGLINSDKKGNCSIPFDKSCIEFVRYSSLPNQNGA